MSLKTFTPVAGAHVPVESYDFDGITVSQFEEQEMGQYASLLKMACRVGNIGAWSLSVPGYEVNWSKEMCVIHGVPLDFLPTFEKALSFYAPDYREPGRELIERCLREGTPYDVQLQIITHEKNNLWVRAIGEVRRDEKGRILGIQGTFQDISGFKRDEVELARTHRALHMLIRCNEALIRTDNETKLLAAICQVAVEIGGLRLAWVGYAMDDEEKSIIPQAYDGVEEGYLAEIQLTWDESLPNGRGPAGRTVRSGKTVFVSDLDSLEDFSPWAEAARQRGYRGIVSLPLRDKKRTFGILVLYLSKVRNVPYEEMRCLEELADNLAFGLVNIRIREERARIQEAVLTIARGVSASIGTAFFEKLTRSLVETLGAYAGFIAQLDPVNQESARTLCAIINGMPSANFEYRLKGTPCEDLNQGDVSIVSSDVSRCYPNSELFTRMSIEAYAGIKLHDSSGRPIGVMFVLFGSTLSQQELVSSALKIFAYRAAAEMERLKADEKLNEKSSLLDNARDAIYVRDLQHQITYWNRSAERIYGWSAKEAIGHRFDELVQVDASKFREADQEVRQHGEWNGEIQKVTRSGSNLTLDCRWTLLQDPQNQPKSILTIDTDITERRKLEQQFLRAQRMECIGTLAGGMAHDLNNVFLPILLAIDILKMNEKTADGLSMLNTIEASAKRGSDMVRHVLSFARGVEGRHQEVQIEELLPEIEKIADETFPKNIQVRTVITSKLWTVSGDLTQLHQVLLNLAVNARDAMLGGGFLTFSVENTTLGAKHPDLHIEAKPGPYVVIQVLDTGAGIPAKILDRIFDPFFTTKDLGKGTGLGLSTSLSIVKSHGGFIHVESQPGKGTKFKVFLPALPPSTPEKKVVAPSQLLRGHGELILVVDDEAAVRKITQKMLEAFGYRVILAGDGAEAIEVYTARQGEISAMVTDMMMPVMDGPTAIQHLRKINPDLPIVAASGLYSNDRVALITSLGVKHFLAKPYTTESLLKALAEMLRGGI